MVLRMILYIVRGTPGSGKGDIARMIAPGHAYSATDYYYKKDGTFQYDPSMLETAHSKCFKAVREDMFKGTEAIAVHNTFVHKWEYENYVDIAVKIGYEIREIICRGDSVVSQYDIPPEKVQRMLKEFEY